jgi:hypothetical protein
MHSQIFVVEIEEMIKGHFYHTSYLIFFIEIGELKYAIIEYGIKGVVCNFHEAKVRKKYIYGA